MAIGARHARGVSYVVGKVELWKHAGRVAFGARGGNALRLPVLREQFAADQGPRSPRRREAVLAGGRRRLEAGHDGRDPAAWRRG